MSTGVTSTATRGAPDVTAWIPTEATPCQGDDSHLWTHRDTAKRERAAALCRDCPLMVECARAALAQGERYGVWGGVDLTGRGTSRKAIARSRADLALVARGDAR